MNKIIESIKNDNTNEFNRLIINVETSMLIKSLIFCIHINNFKYFKLLFNKFKLEQNYIELIKCAINNKNNNILFIEEILKNKIIVNTILKNKINLLTLFKNDSIDILEFLLNHSDLNFNEDNIMFGLEYAISNKQVNIFQYFLNHYPEIFYIPNKSFYRKMAKINLEFIDLYINNNNFLITPFNVEFTMSAYKADKFKNFEYFLEKKYINTKLVTLILSERIPEMRYVDKLLDNSYAIRLIPDNFKIKSKDEKLQKKIDLAKIKYNVVNF